MRIGPTLLVAAVLIGCAGPACPASTDTSSDSLPSLDQRIEFLQRYVTFRRTYTDLGFRVVYHNNAGVVPGPSDWDIRLVAVVPPGEVAAWVPVGVAATPSCDAPWLVGVPGAELANGAREWYPGPGFVVGIDRERSVVAYRRWTR